MSRFALGLTAFSLLLLCSTHAEEAVGVPPDPFKDLVDTPDIPGYPIELDRSRGSFVLTADEGNYVPGSHFAHWHWKANAERWGNYFVGIEYASKQPKLGVQVRVGEEAVLKGYAPRNGGPGKNGPLVVGTAYLPKAGEYPVTLLTGAPSNVPTFQVKGIHFMPAPESEPLGQSIDGTIELHAKSATTFATKMRYEPKPEKDCLGFWSEIDDWAEWQFDVSTPGTFRLELDQGCGEGPRVLRRRFGWSQNEPTLIGVQRPS